MRVPCVVNTRVINITRVNPKCYPARRHYRVYTVVFNTRRNFSEHSPALSTPPSRSLCNTTVNIYSYIYIYIYIYVRVRIGDRTAKKIFVFAINIPDVYYTVSMCNVLNKKSSEFSHGPVLIKNISRPFCVFIVLHILQAVPKRDVCFFIHLFIYIFFFYTIFITFIFIAPDNVRVFFAIAPHTVTNFIMPRPRTCLRICTIRVINLIITRLINSLLPPLARGLFNKSVHITLSPHAIKTRVQPQFV
jgi:hypothetical protein